MMAVYRELADQRTLPFQLVFPVKFFFFFISIAKKKKHFNIFPCIAPQATAVAVAVVGNTSSRSSAL